MHHFVLMLDKFTLNVFRCWIWIEWNCETELAELRSRRRWTVTSATHFSSWTSHAKLSIISGWKTHLQTN